VYWGSGKKYGRGNPNPRAERSIIVLRSRTTCPRVNCSPAGMRLSRGIGLLAAAGSFVAINSAVFSDTEERPF
jgi:hypothetical protein